MTVAELKSLSETEYNEITVRELIAKLMELDQDATVRMQIDSIESPIEWIRVRGKSITLMDSD